MNPRSAYREAAVRGASPVRLVVLLYEQMIQDLSRAIQAVEHHDIEHRTREINHALTVCGFLQSNLDMDRGGQVAANLVRFYTTLRSTLLEAHGKASQQILSQQISCLLEVRDGWLEVEKQSVQESLPAFIEPDCAIPPSDRRSQGWSG